MPTYLRDDWRTVRINGMPPRSVGMALRRRGMLGAPARAVVDVITEIVFDTSRLPAGVRAVRPDQELASLDAR